MGSHDPIRRGRHAIWECHAHLVFVTKYRRGALTSEVLDTCRAAMEKVCADFGAHLEEFNGEEDHVHLLVQFPATVALSSLVNSLKGVSSRQMRKAHKVHLERYLWGGHLWSRSYYAGTVGGPSIDRVTEYIRSQRTPAPATSTLKDGARAGAS